MESITYHRSSLATALRNAHIAHTSAVVEKSALVCAFFFKMAAAAAHQNWQQPKTQLCF